MADPIENSTPNPTPKPKPQTVDPRLKMFEATIEAPKTAADKEILNQRSKLVKGGDPLLKTEFGHLKNKPMPYPEINDPTYKYNEKINKLITKVNSGIASDAEKGLLDLHNNRKKNFELRGLERDATRPDLGTQLLDIWKKDIPSDLESIQSAESENTLDAYLNIFESEETKNLKAAANVKSAIARRNSLYSDINSKLEVVPQLYKERNYNAIFGIQKGIRDMLAENQDIFPAAKKYKILDVLDQKAFAAKATESSNNYVVNKNKSIGDQLIKAVAKQNFLDKKGPVNPNFYQGAFRAVSALSRQEYPLDTKEQYGPAGEEDVITWEPIVGPKFNELTNQYLGTSAYSKKEFIKDFTEGKNTKTALVSGAQMLTNVPGSDLYSGPAIKAFFQNMDTYLTTEKGQEIAANAQSLFKRGLLQESFDNYKEIKKERANLLLYKNKLVEEHKQATEAARSLGRALPPRLETPELDQKIEQVELRLNSIGEETREIYNYDIDKTLEKQYPEYYKKVQLQRFENSLFNSEGMPYELKLGLSLKQAGKQIYDRWVDYDLSGSITASLFDDDEIDQAKRNLDLSNRKFNSDGYTIGIDDKGNAVKSGQFYWTDAQGNSHFNPYSMVESGIPVAEHMLETILLAEIGGAFIGAGARMTGAALEATAIPAYGKMFATDIAEVLGMGGKQIAALSNKVNAAKNFAVSDAVTNRLLTVASVGVTSYPATYQEELKNFKNPLDARNVALLRSFGSEGLSEAIIPNVGSLFTRGAGGLLRRGFNTQMRDAFEVGTKKLFPGVSNRFVRGVADSRFVEGARGVGKYLKGKAPDLFQEAVVEEEFALIANHFVDKIAKQKDSSYVMQNELTVDNIMKTAIEATAGMAITAPFLGGGSARAQNFNTAAARWNIAMNPESFKSYVASQFEKGKITREEYGNKLANINQISEEVKNLPINIGSIRDLETLLEDKDAQLQYFSDHLEKQALLNTVPTDEQRAEYDKALENIDKRLYKTERKALKYRNFTPQEKQEIIAKNLDKKYNNILSHEDLSPRDLAFVIAQYEKDIADNPEVYPLQLQGYADRLKNSFGRVRANFVEFLRNNNNDLTFEQLDYKLNFLLQPNKNFLDTQTYEELRDTLNLKMGEVLAPMFELENEDQFIEALAKNYVTAKEKQVPLVTNGKPLLREVMDGYVNEKLFNKFVEGLPEELKKEKLEYLKNKFLDRVVELKQNTTEEQTFPEVPTAEETAAKEAEEAGQVPVPSQSVEVTERYQDRYLEYTDFISKNNVEEAENLKDNIALELLTEQSIPDLLTALENVKPFFGVATINKIMEDIQEGKTESFEAFLRTRGVSKGKVTPLLDKFFEKKPAVVVEEAEAKAEQVSPETIQPEESFQEEPVEETDLTLKENPSVEVEELENIQTNNKNNKITESQNPETYNRQDYVYLGITDYGFDGTRLDEPQTNLIYNLIDRIEGQVNKADLRSLGYHLLIKSDTAILATLGIEPEYKESFDEFFAQFVVNGIPVLNTKQIEFYHKNFNKLGTFRIGVITDGNQNVITFNKDGVEVKNGTPITVSIGQPGQGVGKDFDNTWKESNKNKEQFVVLSKFIDGTGGQKQPLAKKDAAKLELIVGQPVTVTARKTDFTLYPGVAYLPTGNANYPYRSTYTAEVTKDTAQNILALVKAFNQMTKNPQESTLPDFFKEMTLPEFITYLRTYAYIPDNSKENSWGIVQTRRKGETERTHVKFFTRKDNNKANVSLSDEDILNLLTSTPTNPRYAGNPKEYFDQGKEFREFTVKNGNITVSRPLNYKEWFASKSTVDKIANRNIAFAKEDIIDLTLEEIPTVLKTPISTDAKAGIERRRQEKLKEFGTSEQQTDKYNIKVLGVNEYVSRGLMELAYANDRGNNPKIGGSGQTLDRIIERGGYSKEELSQLLKPEIDKINAKYDAELEALEGAKPEAPTFEVGKYVRFSKDNDIYIVTKFNANGTIQIYNPNKQGAAAKKSVSPSNLTPLTTNKAMQWGRENGNRKAILALAAPQTEITTTAKPIILDSAQIDSIVNEINDNIQESRASVTVDTPYTPQKGETIYFEYYDKPYVGTFLGEAADGSLRIDVPGKGIYEHVPRSVKNIKKVEKDSPLFGETSIILERAKSLGNFVSPEQNEKAKKWLENEGKKMFGKDRFIFEEALLHPTAYAIWSEAGIRLFADANYAEGYHESWHEFTQMYFTPEERNALYEKGRKIYGKDLSDFDIEEKLAESFRQYMLEGKMPQEIQKQKEARTLFEKIADFLRNFFTNKKTVDRYFKNLAKGRIGARKGFPGFKTLYSNKRLSLYKGEELITLSFVQTKEFLDTFDQLFSFVGNELAKEKGVSYIQLFYNVNNIKAVYTEMSKYLVALRNEAITRGDQAALVELNDILGADFNNLKLLISFHNKNSEFFTADMLLDSNTFERRDAEMAEQEGGINFNNKSIEATSQKELTPAIVLNLVKTIPEVENGEVVMNSLTGVPVFGDLDTNWNILKNTLGGSKSYDEMIERIEKLSQDFPQFAYLLDLLPKDIKGYADQEIRNKFFNTLSMAKTTGLTVFYNADGSTRINVTSSLATKQVKDRWLFDFNVDKEGDFKELSETVGTYKLDSEALFARFKEAPKSPEDVIEFLEGIGFKYSQKALQYFIDNIGTTRGYVTDIYNKLKSAASQGVEIFDPYSVISKRHEYLEEEDGKMVSKSYPGQSYTLNRLFQVEVDNNPAYANDMVEFADGTMNYMVNPPTLQSKVLAALNDTTYEYYEDLIKAYPFLNPNLNWGIENSAYITNFLFDFTSEDEVNGEVKHRRKKTEGKYNSLELISFQGAKSDVSSFLNKKTIDLTDAEKHLTDIKTLLSPVSRTEENNRLGDKSTTRGFRVAQESFPLFGRDTFYGREGQFQPKGAVWNTIFNYVKAEVAVTDKESFYNNFNKHKFANNVPQLSYFSHIFTDELKLDLYEFIKNNPDAMFEDYPQRQNMANQFYAYMLGLKNTSKNIIYTFQDRVGVEQENNFLVSDSELLRYHFLSFIHRVEQSKLFYYHPYYYKSVKDEEKRITGTNATGTYPVLDEANLNFIAPKLVMQSAFEIYAAEKSIKVEPRQGSSKDFTYLVFKDQKVDSQTARENKESYGERYNDYTNTKADKQDAASVVTLDFYKKFYSLAKGLPKDIKDEIERQEGIWTNLLRVKLNSEDTVAREKLEALLNTPPYFVFSVKKLQYTGPGVLPTEILPILHKYANKTLLPSEVVDNEEAFNILVKLHASNADYGVFGSGTKIAETVNQVDLFNTDGTVDTTGHIAGVGSLEYLKEQVEVEHKEDFLIIFSTQFRKLLFRDIDSKEEKEQFELYKEYVELLVNYDKSKFLKNIEDKELAVNFLIKILSKKNISALTLDLIKLKEDSNELATTMDSIIDRTLAESAVISETKKAIIRQKFYGSQFVQFPVSLVRPKKKLKFYRLENGKIASAEAIISFSKKYYSLLNLPYDKNSTIGEFDEKGNIINPYYALKRLNEKLGNPTFRKKYKDSLTLAGVRIPVQGYNSMEKMEIVEFLPEESGQLILVPDEIVIKSGGDFDIDKLFMYEPFLKDGVMFIKKNLPKYEKNLQKQLDVLDDYIFEAKEIFKEVNTLKEIITEAEKTYEETQQTLEEEDLRTQLLNSNFVVSGNLSDIPALNEETRKHLQDRLSESEQDIDLSLDRIKNTYNAYFAQVGLDISKTNKGNGKKLKAYIDNLYLQKQVIKQEMNQIRNILQNNLLNVIKDRLSDPKIFNDLIEPNNTNNVSEAAKNAPDYLTKDVNKNTVREDRQVWSNIVNPLYQLHVYQLAHIVDMVGTAAKAGTFLTSAQDAKLEIIDRKAIAQIYFDVHKNSAGNIELWRIYDVDKVNKVSQIISEYISGSVDVLKSDDIRFANIIPETIGVAIYLDYMGARFSDVTKFLQDKLIYRYAKGVEFEQLVLEYLPEEFQNLVVYKQYGPFDKQATASKISQEITKDDFLKDNSDWGSLKRLANYIVLENQQVENFLPLILGVDFDTFSPQNFESLRKKINEVGEVRKRNFFNREAIDKIVNESAIAPFQVQEDVVNKFTALFPISAQSVVTDDIIRKHNALKKSGKNVPYETFSRRYKNELMSSIWSTYIPEVNDYVRYMRVSDPVNIKEMYNTLKKQAAEFGVTIPLFDDIIFTNSSVPVGEDLVSSAYIAPGMRRSENEVDVNVKKEQFYNNLNYEAPEGSNIPEEFEDQVRDFFKVLAYTGILSTNLNKTYSSFLPIIPETIYSNAINPFVESLGAKFEAVKEKELEMQKNIVKEQKALRKKKEAEGTLPTKDEMYAIVIKNEKQFNEWKAANQGNLLDRFFTRFRYNNPEWYNIDFRTIPNPSLKQYKNYNLAISEATLATRLPSVISVERVSKVEDQTAKIIADNNKQAQGLEGIGDVTNSEDTSGVNESTQSTINDPVVVVTRELRNQLGRFGSVAENNNTEIVTIDGEQFAIIDLSKPKKGYTTFYGSSVEPNVLLKKTGKPIVVPGYEDIKLMVETDKTVIELSTGLSITTKGKSFDSIEKELKEKFDSFEGTEKSVRTFIKEARKLKANNPGVNIVSLTNQRVETANLQENAATLINQQNIDAVNTNPTNVSVTDQIVNQLNQQPEDESQCSVGE
jgi:hypothetical protein